MSNAEEQNYPQDRGEKAKGANLWRKFRIVSFSEVETLCATLFEPLPSCHSPKADPSTITDDRFCRQRFAVN